ncbi:MAG: VCBS repeat-containing protein [Saprospiraceae bacterium]|nr:VCBS repeat-containing protein [Saprospiraceae bacterium]
MAKKFEFLVTIAVSALLMGCNGKHSQNKGEAGFELLRKSQTGLDFKNTMRQTIEFNVFNYMYFFNGGGVGAGDFNNDGLVDLFFTSNMDENKLFLNQGNLKFKDVTEETGLKEGLVYPKWTTGVSVVDINNDGNLDLYINQVGRFQNIKGRNLLYINKGVENGIPKFAEEAIPYGLDLVGFGTQATFFDYDLDGDLDLYQMNHSLHANGTFGQKRTFKGTRDSLAGDFLLRNDDGVFTDVTDISGIDASVIGYGLGVATGDINQDGWPDIYIGNDFHENDYLYLNVPGPNGGRAFKEVLTEQIQHTSQFSMGVDIGDINNDAWSDIISLDMLPDDPAILKSSLGEDDYALNLFKLGYGYNQQFARNNLQLNKGDGHFQEIGMFAGVHATDWSWTSLFMDFDDDGWKDLFIANGIPHRMNDIDYVKFRENSEVRYKGNSNNLEEADLVYIDKMPKIKLKNKFFKNDGKLRFDDLTNSVDGNTESYSNGAIYADLDNDGDLDIVTNNIDDEPFVYKNLTSEKKRTGKNAWLSLQFKGSPKNVNGIGAKVVVFKKEGKLVYENYPVRGYQSSMLGNLHVGLGDTTTIDSVLVIWPGSGYQKLQNIRYNSIFEAKWQAGLPVFEHRILSGKQANSFAFEDLTQAAGLIFKHKENPFVEFDRERLTPNMVSSEGPALAIGDVNGDGLEDVFFGSSKRTKSVLFYQKPNGSFVENTPKAIQSDSLFEDVDAVFVDIEKDGDLDLVIAAGGNEYQGKDEAMKQRYYLNDGKGNFQRLDFQGVYMTASCVLPTDFNKDGLVDFFLGARAMPWKYGMVPTSALLMNKGNGQFENVTKQIAPELEQVGFVKNGQWADMDKDGDEDLVLALEWDAPAIFYNEGNSFKKTYVQSDGKGGAGLLKGWWNFVLANDFDKDGDMDILAGNLGENARFKPNTKEPIKLYVNDFDDNDQIEQILTYHLGGREIPFANFDEITQQLPPLKKQYLYARDFAKASLPELFGKEKIDKSLVYEANELRSTYFENKGGGQFEAHFLPDELQFSTLNAAQLIDLNQDGQNEIVVAGNFYDCNIEMGRYDANFGNVLTIGKAGKMEVFPLGELRVMDQVRRIRTIKRGKQNALIFARNNSTAMLIAPKAGKPVQ